jgi:protein SCO1/2
VLSLLVVAMPLMACSKRESFEEAISKHRNSLVDQVNPVGKGAPYFTLDTLNPVWALTNGTPIVKIPKFQLIDQEGRTRDESLFQNKLTVVGFMFTSCSGFCPFLLNGMKSIDQEAKASGHEVQYVALTVNPEQDTPDKLKAYAQQRKLDTDKNWILLTGDKDTIYSLAKKTFASQAFKRQSVSPSFVHSEHLYVIDTQSRLRGILNGTRVNVKNEAKALLNMMQ